MPNGTYGGVRGRKTKVGRKLSFSSYSIFVDMFLNIHTRNQLVSRKCLSLSYPDANAYNMLVI